MDKAIATQDPFEWWFFIHWVMYIISSFLSLSLLFEAIYEKIQASTIVTQPGIDFSALGLIFLVLFAFSNSFFSFIHALELLVLLNQKIRPFVMSVILLMFLLIIMLFISRELLLII